MMKTATLLLLLGGFTLPLQASEAPVTSPGKPAHPVAVELVMPKRLDAGETAEAELRVSSRVPLASLDVELLQMTNVTATETRFSRDSGEAGRRGIFRLPLRLTATAGEPGRVLLEVRAMTTEGHLLTRQLELATRPDASLLRKQPAKREQREVRKVEPGKDVVVPAEQTIRD